MSAGAVPAEPGRWRFASLALWAGAALLATVAVVERSATPLFLAIPLLVAPAAAWAGRPGPGASGALAWTDAGEGRDVRIEGRVSLGPGVASDAVALHLPATDPLQGPPAPTLTRTPGEIRIRWKLTASRPCLASLPVPSASWVDPIGLVEQPIALEGMPLHIERFPPEVARLRATQLRRTTVFPGEVRSREHGPAGEFFGLRASQPGDTPRQINWRGTARAGALLANDFYRERTGDLLLVLDLRPTPLGPRRDAEVAALGAAAAFGIASAFLAEKARVGLVTFSEFAETVPLGSGRTQALRLRNALQAARVGEVGGPVERLAVSVRRYFPPGVGTLVISSLSDPEAPLLLAHLRRRGYPPFVLSPSPLPLLAPRDRPMERVDRLAERLVRLARRQRLAEAWAEAPVVEWEEYWSLGPLARFLSRPLDRRTGTA